MLSAPWVGVQVEVDDLLFLAAQQGQDPMRRQLGERFGELEVVGELGACLLLAIAHARDDAPLRPHLLAQPADQVRVFDEALDEDRAGAVERGIGVRHVLPCVDVARGGGLGTGGGIRQQLIGQWFETRLAGDLRSWAIRCWMDVVTMLIRLVADRGWPGA